MGTQPEIERFTPTAPTTIHPPPALDPLAITLSGGGFRATLAGLGALRLVADTGSFGNLKYSSSVSGGSIANAVMAVAWPKLRNENFTTEAFDRLVIDPVVDKVSRHSLTSDVAKNLWRAVGSMTRTDVLAHKLDEWFFGGVELEQLDPSVRWMINAANLTTGVGFTFERDVIGEYITGYAETAGSGLKVSLAVAASAAVPGYFASVVLDQIGFSPGMGLPVLVDGGAYDNTGLESLDDDHFRHSFLFAINAGGLFRPRWYARVPFVRELAGANALLYRQSTGLRTRAMVDQFRRARATPIDQPLPRGSRRGVLTNLGTTFERPHTDTFMLWNDTYPEHRTYKGRDLSSVPTVFDRMDEQLCRALVYRGWWLMGAALAKFHPERLRMIASIAPPPL